MSEEILVKVINKNKDGVKVRSLDEKIEKDFSWADFNQYFVETETKYIYKIVVSDEENKEMEKVIARRNSLLPNIATIFMIITKQKRGNDLSLAEYSIFGNIVKEYLQNYPGTTIADFLEDVQGIKESLLGTKNI